MINLAHFVDLDRTNKSLFDKTSILLLFQTSLFIDLCETMNNT